MTTLKEEGQKSIYLMYDAGSPKPVPCDNLEGGCREGGGMGVQDGGDTCMPMADSC